MYLPQPVQRPQQNQYPSHIPVTQLTGMNLALSHLGPIEKLFQKHYVDMDSHVVELILTTTQGRKLILNIQFFNNYPRDTPFIRIKNVVEHPWINPDDGVFNFSYGYNWKNDGSDTIFALLQNIVYPQLKDLPLPVTQEEKEFETLLFSFSNIELANLLNASIVMPSNGYIDEAIIKTEPYKKITAHLQRMIEFGTRLCQENIQMNQKINSEKERLLRETKSKLEKLNIDYLNKLERCHGIRNRINEIKVMEYLEKTCETLDNQTLKEDFVDNFSNEMTDEQKKKELQEYFKKRKNFHLTQIKLDKLKEIQNLRKEINIY